MANYQSLFHALEILSLLSSYGSTALADASSSSDTLTYPAFYIYKAEAHWINGQSLNVTGCTNISIVINSNTLSCCNAVVLTNSACGKCSAQGLSQCFVNSETTSHSFKEGTNSSCTKATDFKIQCVACLPGHCPHTKQSKVTTSNPKMESTDESLNPGISTPVSTPTQIMSTERSVTSRTESTRKATLTPVSTPTQIVSTESSVTSRTESTRNATLTPVSTPTQIVSTERSVTSLTESTRNATLTPVSTPTQIVSTERSVTSRTESTRKATLTPVSMPTQIMSTERSVTSRTESTRKATLTPVSTEEVYKNSTTSSNLVSESSLITFPTVTVPDNSSNSTLNETSTERPFDLEKSKRDMYTFLGALGAALLLVLIIVCAFFIRKSRSKIPVVNISDEFWSSKDYITDPDDGYFCPGASYSVINPVCNTKSYTARNSYLKNEEACSPKYVKTGSIRPSYKSYSPQDENDFKLEPISGNLSERERVCSTDDEAGVVMDLTKIVSNEIQMQQRAQNIVDRKIISDRATINTTQPSSSNGHYRKGKRHKETRQRMRSGQRASREATARNDETKLDQQMYTGDIYAVAYKNRFHEYLDKGSAEESDV